MAFPERGIDAGRMPVFLQGNDSMDGSSFGVAYGGRTSFRTADRFWKCDGYAIERASDESEVG